MNRISTVTSSTKVHHKTTSSTKPTKRVTKRKPAVKKPIKASSKLISTILQPTSSIISTSTFPSSLSSFTPNTSHSTTISAMGFAPPTFITFKVSKQRISSINHMHNNITQYQHRLFTTFNLKPTVSTQIKSIPTSAQHISQLRNALISKPSRPHQIHRFSQRTFMKQAISNMADAAVKIFNFGRNFTNPFRPKRNNNRMQLEGRTDILQKLKMVGIAIGVGVIALYSIKILFKFAILAIKVGIVAFIINKLRQKFIELAVNKGDLDRAILFETWGESHAHSSAVAKFMWLANPISWFRKAHALISIDRRKNQRCREIANEVITGLQSDPRMVTMFGQDFIIGPMARNVGSSGLDEEEMYDGFITIPIYSTSPQIIDVTVDINESGDQNKAKKKPKQRKTSKDAGNDFVESNRKEIDRRTKERYGSDPSISQQMEIIDELVNEEIENTNANEDQDYPYKFYRSIPKWKQDTMDPEIVEAMNEGKKATFFNHPDITDRANILDFETAALQWQNYRWDYIESKANPQTILTPVSKDLIEVGTVYAFFSIPALETPVEQGDGGRIKVDALNILTGGTKQPFELQKTFVVGENVERFTLYQRGVANWSKNNKITKDRTIDTFNRLQREELDHEQQQESQSKRARRRRNAGEDDDVNFMSAAQAANSTRTVGVSNDKNRTPIIEAETLSAEDSQSVNSSEKPVFREAEIVFDSPKPITKPKPSHFNDDVGAR